MKPRYLVIRYETDPADKTKQENMEQAIIMLLRVYGWVPYFSNQSELERIITFQRKED